MGQNNAKKENGCEVTSGMSLRGKELGRLMRRAAEREQTQTVACEPN